MREVEALRQQEDRTLDRRETLEQHEEGGRKRIGQCDRLLGTTVGCRLRGFRAQLLSPSPRRLQVIEAQACHDGGQELPR